MRLLAVFIGVLMVPFCWVYVLPSMAGVQATRNVGIEAKLALRLLLEWWAFLIIGFWGLIGILYGAARLATDYHWDW